MPRDEPPVGTLGLPFLDLFFSGCVGSSQLPSCGDVVENARRKDPVVLNRVRVQESTDDIVLEGCIATEDNDKRPKQPARADCWLPTFILQVRVVGS